MTGPGEGRTVTATCFYCKHAGDFEHSATVITCERCGAVGRVMEHEPCGNANLIWAPRGITTFKFTCPSCAQECLFVNADLTEWRAAQQARADELERAFAREEEQKRLKREQRRTRRERRRAGPRKKLTPGQQLRLAGTILVAVILLGVVARWAGFSVGSSGGDAGQGQATAVRACENAVRQQLKSPTSAQFSGVAAAGDSSQYQVSGSVDAENSFGVKLRVTWRCAASIQGNGTWAGLASLDEP